MPANPPLIDSLPFWLTAEANVTMDDNSRVSDWADPRPGLRHAAQAAGLPQPLFVSNALGAFPVIRWAGGQSLYILGGPLGDTNFTIFVAGRANADRVAGGSPVNGQRLLFYQYGGPDSAGTSLSVGANGIGLYEFGPTISPRMEAAVDASVLCPLAVRYENQTPAIFLNGAQVGAFVNPSTMFTQPVVQIPNTVGGIGDSLADGFVGDIAEILIYNRALSEAERQQVEAYLQAKYGCLASSSSSLEPEQSSESLVPSAFPSSDSGESLSSIPSVPGESSASPLAEDVPDPVPVSEGLGAWLRSDRHVTEINGVVQSWADARGLPITASQPDTSRQPGWVTNGFGLFPGVDFGNGGASLQLPDFGWPAGEFTLIILARPGADRAVGGALTAGGQRVLWSGSPGGSSFAISAGTNGVALYEAALSAGPIAETTAPTTSLCPLTLRYGGGVRTLFLNGSAVWSQPDSNAQQVNVGRSLGGIEADNTGSGFNGMVAEVLIYNRALSDQERVLVETYLQARYGCLASSSSVPGESPGSSESPSSESPSSPSSDSSSSGPSDSSSSEPSQENPEVVWFPPVIMDSRDKFLSGSIDTNDDKMSSAQLQFINIDTGEDLGQFDLNSSGTHIYPSEDDIFSEQELDDVIGDSADENSPAMKQEVVFFRDPDNTSLIQFRTTFNQLGTIEARVLGADGSTLGTVSHTLTEDSQFSSLIDFEYTRIRSIDAGALATLVNPEDEAGNGEAAVAEDLTYYDDSTQEEPPSSPPAAPAPSPQPAPAVSPAPPLPWKGHFRNLLSKALHQARRLATDYVGYSKGFIDGFWDGIKSDAEGMAELAKMVGGIFIGDFHRGKAIWDGIKLLASLDKDGWKLLLKTNVDKFLSEAQRNLPWEFNPGDSGDHEALIAYVVGYCVGFVIEQAIVIYLLAGLISKVGQGVKIIVTAARAGTLAAETAAGVQKFMVPATHFLSQFVKDTESLRLVRKAVFEAGNISVGAGKLAGEVIQEAILRFDAAIVNYKKFAEYIQEISKALQLPSWDVTRTTSVYLARTIIVLGTDMTADAFLGMIRFFPYTLSADGKSFFRYVVLFCTDNGVVNANDLNKILEMFSPTPGGFRLTKDAIDPTIWKTPSGMKFGRDLGSNKLGHRITHLLHHCVEVSGRPVPHGVFKIPRAQLIEWLDDVWKNWGGKSKIRVGPPPPNTWDVSFADEIGRANNLSGGGKIDSAGYRATKTMRIAINESNGMFITTFPVNP